MFLIVRSRRAVCSNRVVAESLRCVEILPSSSHDHLIVVQAEL